MSTSIEDSDAKNTEEKKVEQYESLKSSKFKQQKLPAWRPVPTITSSTVTFFLFGTIFLLTTFEYPVHFPLPFTLTL